MIGTLIITCNEKNNKWSQCLFITVTSSAAVFPVCLPFSPHLAMASGFLTDWQQLVTLWAEAKATSF